LTPYEILKIRVPATQKLSKSTLGRDEEQHENTTEDQRNTAPPSPSVIPPTDQQQEEEQLQSGQVQAPFKP